MIALVTAVAFAVAPTSAQEKSKAMDEKAPAKMEVKTGEGKPVESLSVSEVADTLRDLKPGQHTITVIHPHTCCPVTVCFCLPCGCYDVKCSCDRIRFDFPGIRNDVVIKFKRGGGVAVHD
jgi:hypothetical protein